MPGSRALTLLSRWFDAATVHRTFEPLIADWQREWSDAPRSRRSLVWVRGLLALATAMIVSSPAIIRTRVPSALSNRIATRITIVVAMLSAVQLVPFAIEWRDRAGILFYLLLLPSAITLAFPFTMTAAIDAIRRHAGVTPQVERATALKLAGVATAFMLVFGGWVTPASNQLWRVSTSPRGAAIQRGVRELTTYELVFPTQSTPAFEPTRIRRELNTRASLVLLPLVLIWLRWGALNRRERKWYAPLPAAVATVATMLSFGALSSLGMWVPAVALISVGGVARMAAHRRIERVSDGT